MADKRGTFKKPSDDPRWKFVIEDGALKLHMGLVGGFEALEKRDNSLSATLARYEEAVQCALDAVRKRGNELVPKTEAKRYRERPAVVGGRTLDPWDRLKSNIPLAGDYPLMEAMHRGRKKAGISSTNADVEYQSKLDRLPKKHCKELQHLRRLEDDLLETQSLLKHGERRRFNLSGQARETPKDPDEAFRAGMGLGRQLERSLITRPLEPEVLAGRGTSVGGQKTQEKKRGSRSAAGRSKEAYQDTLDQVSRQHPDWKHRAVEIEVGKLHGVTDRTIREHTSWE